MTTLTDRAMLVDLTIRQWQATKNDKRVNREVATSHGSDETMGRYTKHLVARDALETIRKLATEAANEHRRRTLPWLDTGARVLSSAGYFDYASAMRGFNARWTMAVNDFQTNYQAYVQDAQRKLNGLFNWSDYPDDISDRFAFAYSVLPLPDAADFRVALGDGETARIRQQIEQATRDALQAAMIEVVDRITATVGRMAERLRAYTVTDQGASGIFRDSLVSNVKDLVELLPSLNLTQDARLTDITQRMRRELCAVSPDALRASEPARMQVAKAAEAILQDMSAFI